MGTNGFTDLNAPIGFLGDIADYFTNG